MHASSKRGKRANTTKTGQKQQPTTTNREEPEHKRNRPPPYQRATTTKKKKKTGAGHDLAKGAEQEVRIEVGVRVRDEETQGEPQTPKGVWGSPAPERKRKREKNDVGEQPKQPEKEKEGTTNTKRTRGQVLKGTKPNTIPTPETKKTKQNTQHPSQKNLTKTRHKTNKVSEDLSPQGGGAHGPPCTFGESPQGTAVPRGTSTPPLREPPPVAQKRTKYPTQDEYPKSCVPALSRSLIT